MASPTKLTVMESFGAIRDTTNPYQVQLVDALTSRADVVLFSWRRALIGHYDVLHVHWPEVLIRGRTRVRTVIRQVLFALLLLRIRLTSRVLVRTAHNLAPHEIGPYSERLLLKLCDRWTNQWICLTEFTPVPGVAPRTVIPHGHYRDWFVTGGDRRPEPGLLLCFGRLRAYKGVADLLHAFEALPDPDVHLLIAGRPETADDARLLTDVASRTGRITLDLRHIPDGQLADYMVRSELVVLPYRHMHNSGVALLALSFDRPILVPDNQVNRALAEEIGAEWVLLFDGPLVASDLVRAIGAVRARPSGARPDLSRREWDEAGRRHDAAFHSAFSGNPPMKT